MAIQIPQVPQNWWQEALNMFGWAWRIPLACFIVFTCGCIAFLGFFLIYRLTAYIWLTWLAQPW